MASLLNPQHILSTAQFDRAKIQDLFLRAEEFSQRDWRETCPTSFNCKVMATLFYEPSTRTRFSFEAAMLKLRGQVISMESAGQFSSAIKGETLEDTIRVTSGYADVIVLRHPQNGAARLAASVAKVPVINAGDGSGEHPTQALLDLFTIQKELDAIDGLEIAFVGDLRYGRTVHSLLELMSRLNHPRVHLIAPPELSLPQNYVGMLKERNVAYSISTDLSSAISKVDVLYITRVQKERFVSAEEYEKVRSVYTIDAHVLAGLKPRSIIMHPLPRVTEIDREVDSDPRAAYFREAQNGLYVRMALLETLLGS